MYPRGTGVFSVVYATRFHVVYLSRVNTKSHLGIFGCFYVIVFMLMLNTLRSLVQDMKYMPSANIIVYHIIIVLFFPLHLNSLPCAAQDRLRESIDKPIEKRALLFRFRFCLIASLQMFHRAI